MDLANQPNAVNGNIGYITQMLMQLIPMAEQCDGELAYFISMAAIHSTDVQKGLIKAKPSERGSIDRVQSDATQASGDAAFLAVAI